ncbi:hypothetical protein [Halpernia frigidisoli]|uniref:Glycosyltransferase RgtA/B/C/D-like domain-containing protein n=1 Tax=Halpernia frigidisoli TaxID=1125876 RepID=A0A1I3E3A4_9FLAO|nr:hypothetical protein [Halpernia frigidisoli]SFH93470.1 hypothetical protein SAMN05443292_0854 [Halpernia frigidisoli]
MLKEFFINFKNHFPRKIFFLSIAVWMIFAVINFLLLQNKFFTGVGILYPFSVIYPNAFLIPGFLVAFLFLFIGFFALKNSRNLNVFVVMFLCFLLILTGNLAQGNLDIAFMQPFYLKGRQYYTDAIHIQNWQIWLRNFNNDLETFQLHTKTHPPFATLLHYFILKFFNGNILALGIVFFLMAFSGVPVFYKCLKLLDFSKENAKKITLLFCIIPSVNIYSLVSIDGIILAFTIFFLYGLLLIIKTNSLNLRGVLISVISFIVINCLSFSGLFLLAFLGILSLFYLFKKDFKLIYLGIIIIFSSVFFFYVIHYFSGYNHLETFQKASHSENPNGFMFLVQPRIYFFTRLEDIGEILVFLSFAVVAVLFSKKYLNIKNLPQKNIFYSAILALLIMFLTGAYGTGETARACLYIVPFVMILFQNLEKKTYDVLFILCLLQCFGMQMIGNFYW